MVTLTLSVTVAATVALSVYNTLTLSTLDGAREWKLLDSQLTTEYDVVLDEDLEVKRDLKITGEGSFLELAGVDCSTEEVAPPGSARLCFDFADNQFKVSWAGSPFTALPSGTSIGPRGLACWDLDDDSQPDEVEDVNGDAAVDVLDCRGQPGSPGLPGAPGAPGTACWDSNANGAGDPEEDANGDKAINVLDCSGPAGDDGSPGAACWDLNGNARGDQNEDANGDESINVFDCRGEDGNDGAPGAACWDLSGNARGDQNEDANGDGTFNVFDCRPAPFDAGIEHLGHEEISGEFEEVISSNPYLQPSWTRIELPPALHAAWKTHVSGTPSLNVQVTAQDQVLDLYVYIAKAEPVVYVVSPYGGQGTFHYMVQAMQ
jgi:hypothetical protein